jgi:cell division protein FtsL
MELITVILLLIAIWVFYKIYQAYTDIVKELKQIKDKCVSKEPLVNHISENYTNKAIFDVKESLLETLHRSLNHS